MVFPCFWGQKKSKKKICFAHEKLKKPPKKVAQNQPRPLFPTNQPRPQPTAKNWFFISWNFGTRHLFSYLCFDIFWCCQTEYISNRLWSSLQFYFNSCWMQEWKKGRMILSLKPIPFLGLLFFTKVPPSIGSKYIGKYICCWPIHESSQNWVNLLP